MNRRLVLLTMVVALGAAASARAADDAAGADFFEKKIRPALDEHCYQCHSAKAKKLKGGLRLDSRDLAIKGGDSGAAIVPGDPEASLLIKALRYKDSELLQMPPDGKLPQETIDAFAEWVKIGAPWPGAAAAPSDAPKPGGINIEEGRKFWSFQPINDAPAPAVRDSGWPKTSVDPYILSNIEKAGLAPAPPAEKRALLRRATYDLIGLPPTPEEIDAFIADDSPGAFAKVVDRLLASPQYGERWGRRWLDVARYADSVDSRASTVQDIAEAWRYRDWVVESFNNDMPYDRFVRLQIAGDVLGAQIPEGGFNGKGIIATGLLAIGNWPGGDADKEKMVTDIVDDQLDVVTRGIMGVTLACARCHDHKFDPFTQKDYYALAGIFFSSHILPGPGQKTEGSPILHIPLASPVELERRAARERRIAELDGELKKLRDAALGARVRTALPESARHMTAAWEWRAASRERPDAPLAEFAEARGLRADALQGWISYLGFGEGDLMTTPLRDIAGKAGLHGWRGRGDTPSVVANTNDADVDFLSIHQLKRSVTAHPASAAPVAIEWRSPIAGRVKVSGGIADADATCGDGVGWSIKARRAGAETKLADAEIVNAGTGKFSDASGAAALDQIDLKPGETIRLSILPKNGHSCDTTTIDLTIAEIGGDARTWNLANDLVGDPLQGNPHADRYGNADAWRFLDLSGQGAAQKGGALIDAWRGEIGRISLEAGGETREIILRAAEAAQKLIDSGAAKPAESPDADAKIYRELVSADGPFRFTPRAEDLPEGNRERFIAMNTEIESLRRETPAPLETAVGIQEGGVPDTGHAGIHDVALHIRGSYARLGEMVGRRFPEVLAGGAEGPKINGSGRAELARWVASAENPLTARVLANRIWQGHFGEGIVRTPGNFGALGERPTHPELLDHLAAFLVGSGWSIKALHREIMLSATYAQSSAAPAETLKADPENRLFARANRRRLEAEALRDAMLAAAGRLDLKMGGPAFRDFNEPRRTIYYRVVRSDRATFGALFDAADPTAIADKRAESTVAPQALFLMNNPFVLAQARSLAERTLREGPQAERDKIAALYARLYGRPATEKEIAVALRLLAEPAPEPNNLGDSETAGSIAAWERLCQVLLCANEFVFVD